MSTSTPNTTEARHQDIFFFFKKTAMLLRAVRGVNPKLLARCRTADKGGHSVGAGDRPRQE